MGFNLSGGQTEKPPAQIVIDNFSGLVTNMAPQDVPSGASPDCSDNGFTPGSVFSRPCLQKVFAAPLYPASQRTYGKTFVANDGTVRNLYFYKNGAITVENVTANPGVETLLTQTSALNCCAKSITLDGREYIAISDGLHGQEVPLQLAYDASGNAQLDRFTSDGPGAPCTIANLILPPVQTAVIPTSGPTVVSISTTDYNPVGGYYTTVTVALSGPPTPPLSMTTAVTISGNTNGVFNIHFGSPILIISPVEFKLTFYSSTFQTGTGGAVSGTGSATMSRANNVVTVQTAAPHQLQPGYLEQATGVPAQPIGGNGITSIVIDNEDFPALATVTTDSPHGLVPQSQVTISGILGANVGGLATNATAVREGGIIQVTTLDAHGLVPGASISLTSFSDTSFNISTTVLQIVDPFNFTVIQDDITNVSTPVTGGSVSLNWPIPDTSTPNFFEVQSAPTPTTFTIQIAYCDGVWEPTSGQYYACTMPWNGQFFVLSVPSPTQFTYTQYGPNATTVETGTVTPYGQAAPGLHKFQVLFQDRQGGITSPSPPVKLETPGGQYLAFSNLPIGPPTTVARIIAATGSGGSQFFYIPVPAQVQGQIVSTATVINDNVTTSGVLDFGDPTLFEALGISNPGNDLANQIVLDSATGFGSYAGRLLTYGQRNRIQSGEGTGGFLNLGFGGGYLPSAPTLPTGWTSTGTGAALAPGHYGMGWSITATNGGAQYGGLSQSAYQDVYGDPITTGNTLYRLRVWLQPSAIDVGLGFTVALTSASTGFISATTISGMAMSTDGSFVEAVFSAYTPNVIPSDLTLSLYATSTTTTRTLLVDEISIIYAAEPYLTDLYGSYEDNPEGIDGLSGVFGPPEEGSNLIFDTKILRNGLYLHSQDPGGKLYSVSGTSTSEPSGWIVNEVAESCGVVSLFASASQAKGGSGSAGEEWIVWISSTGGRIFGGSDVSKITQEIESDSTVNPYGVPDWASLNTAAQLTCWCVNDPQSRNIWFGMPVGASVAPNLIFPMNYIGLDSAEAIANSPPVHLSLAGKMIARDMSRKWSRWKIPINYGALMYRTPSSQQPVFMGGAMANGTVFGNCYTLNQAYSTDDDYGLVSPYYTTTAIPTTEQAEQFQTGSLMNILAYLTSSVTWIGVLNVQLFVNYLNNPWPISLNLAAEGTVAFDLEWGAGQATGQRFFIQVGTTPIPNQTPAATANSFNLTRIMAGVKLDARMPVRGRNG